ncbi:glycerol-3-phosphate dehydrogenase [Microbaculum marinisediminis]|uniref:Glycerol-3-phosphate dehydrogenase n=1 Tax=Microbaculum marinisediminis TaxID=2931392 RepID=A0AAW5QW04_9HYPH|nr:glycerol-3-phosphate dehydrogenase [Microbaculum sp. A6E488]MCT8972246.1 glycerol-3-phosphate dehydrogenase [Microbaculum sp. A6E488]
MAASDFTSDLDYDVFVIGGGINGAGVARDAAGRGFSVGLAEKDDLASGTSSGSTKLIHGGLRYLEFYEFRLVREALVEREVLWLNAPHIIWPLRFVLPHQAGLRPAWMLRLGLYLYDYIGGRRCLPPARTIDLRTDPAGKPLKPGFSKAFEYSDCWVQDARLVALNARDAAARGADIMTRTECTGLQREDGGWRITLKDRRTGATRQVTARLVVNAAGPWVDAVLTRVAGLNRVHNIRLVQGSHIVVPRLFDHDRCYIFQNADGRVMFAIPYENDFTLIGTTDRDFDGDLDHVAIAGDEVAYLCAAASEYFANPVTPDQVVWTYSAVRPLYDDGASKAQEATRDYVLKIDGDAETGALVNVFGGKITTYRRLAEAVMADIEGILGTRGPAWTSSAALPGGDFRAMTFDRLVDDIGARHPALPRPLIHRLVRNYGTEARRILADAKSLDALGTCFGADLYEAEVRFLIDREWARTADDVLWRRSKLGLRLSADEAARLQSWMARVQSEAGQPMTGAKP